MELSKDEVKDIINTLYLAQYELDTTHGLLVTDIPPANPTWTIDNADVQKAILKSIDFLEYRLEAGK